MKALFSFLAARSSRSLAARKPAASLAALTVAFGALTASAVVANATPQNAPVVAAVGDPSDPYASVMNPFGAGAHLMRDDDMVVTLGNEIGSGEQLRWLSTIPTSGQANPQCTGSSEGCGYNYYQNDNEATATVGRFFNTKSDSIIEMPGTLGLDSPTTVDTLVSNDSGGYSAVTSQVLPYTTDATTTVHTAVGDFNQDGYDDILAVYSDQSTQFTNNGRARIGTAVDVNNPAAGLSFSGESALAFPYGARSVAAGDFRGDGRIDFAVLYVDNNNNPNIAVYSVNDDMTVTLQNTNLLLDPVNDLSVDAPMQLIAGTFTAAGNQQLVLIQTSASLSKTVIRVFDFDNNRSWYYPYQMGELVTDYSWATNVKVVAGRFDWSSPTQSLAVMLTKVDNGNSQSDVQILKIDPVSYGITVAGSVNVPKGLYNSSDKNYVALDIAVGDFDNFTFVGLDGDIVNLPDEQLAIATGYCQGQNLGANQFRVEDVFTMSVTPDGSSIQKFGQTSLQTSDGTQGMVSKMAVEAADLQGRSMRLGPGTRTVLDKSSPTMILAQPPSHVDLAAGSNGTLTLVNQSLSPSGFNANFQSSTAQTVSNNQTYSNGWTWGAQETLNSKIVYGTKETNVNASESLSAMQDWNKNYSQTYGTQSSFSQSYDTATSTNDVVLSYDSTSYLYVYQVVGQTTCPEGMDTCADSQKVPLTVSFTAPGPENGTLSAADSLYWYQPTWENNNVLSYPGNMQQLLAGTDNMLSLNVATTEQTDSSKVTSTTTWSGEQNQSNNVTSTKVLKEDSQSSIGAVATVPLVGKGSVSLSVDVNHSSTLGSLQSKSATISASTTLGVVKTASFHNEYAFTPVILGQNTPPNYFDPANPNADWTQPISSNGITTFGPTRTAFTVDPLSGAGTSWWEDTYGQQRDGSTPFDVALNHPIRWHNVNISTTNPVPSNCVPSGNYMDCTEPTSRVPTNPEADDFHSMRGFFVFSGATNPADFTNQGMQVQLANAGDALTLEARIYNYSLNAMPAGTNVKANFYAMPWNGNYPAQADGQSTFIGQWVGAPIQPFNTDTAIPNYVVASVAFNTTGFSGDYAFWMVVWAEDANGNMLGELSGKGLTANPGSLKSTNYADFVALEPTATWTDASQTPQATVVSSGSNNIGFYENIFYIQPPSLQATQLGSPLTSSQNGDIKSLTVGAPTLPRREIKIGEFADISATLSNAGEPMKIATAYFYDGDPDAGGKMVGARRMPYIETSGQRTANVHYAPSTCGLHDIYLKVVHHGLATAKVKALDSIEVDCRGSSAPDGGAPDGGIGGGGSGDLGTGLGGGSAPGTGNGLGSSNDLGDSDGGCSVAPGAQGNGLGGWIAPLGMAIGSIFARRKRKA